MAIELVIFDLDAIAHLDVSPPREVFGMTPALRRLRARRIASAICTSQTRRETHELLRSLDWLGDMVDACVTTDDVGRAAPFPDMVFQIMRDVSVRDVRRVVKVSASHSGVVQGASAGCALVVGIGGPGLDPRVLRVAPCTLLVPTPAIVPST
jgi:beta-phosphoglucomutase-like phosphatase (HAD superfamily)